MKLFLQVLNPEFAIARVQQRVREGGHSVPDEVLRRRFYKGLKNFQQIYKNNVDEWAVYDNSGKVPVLIDEGSKL